MSVNRRKTNPDPESVCWYATHLSCLLLLCAVIHPIDLLGKLCKVRDDELFFKSLSQQHDVVAHTPTRVHVTPSEDSQRSSNTDAVVNISSMVVN